MEGKIPPFLLSNTQRDYVRTDGTQARASFVERGICHLTSLMKMAYAQWETANRGGFLQQLDTRVKLVFLLVFLVVASIKRTLLPEVSISFLVLLLVVASRLDVLSFYSKVWVYSFFFGFLIVLPSALNVVVKGEALIPLFHLSRSYQFWIYHIPETVSITREGLEGVAMFTIRVMNCFSLSLLLIHTTSFAQAIKGLKGLHAPDLFLMILTLCYKYLFVFSQILEDIYLARKSRMVSIKKTNAKDWVAGRIVFLFRKTASRCEALFGAMEARGYSGDVKIYTRCGLGRRDIVAGSFLFIAGLVLVIL
jgi:cobalt/nickel transport system permease protein